MASSEEPNQQPNQPSFKSNPNNYRSEQRFKLSSFSSYYSFFNQSEKPSRNIVGQAFERITLKNRLNFISTFLYKQPLPLRTLLFAGLTMITFVGYHELPDASADDTISYWTNIPRFDMTNLFKSRLYHKKETCFSFKVDMPYPYESEYDLVEGQDGKRYFISEEFNKFWEDFERDSNDPKAVDKVHPLDMHIFTIRQGKPIDLEHLWYLYLQVHSIKYDAIHDLMKENRVSNDLMYDLKIASTVDYEQRYFTNMYAVNTQLDTTGKSLDELIEQNIKYQNSISILDGRALNENYQIRLKTMADLLTPQDYLRQFYTENRKYRFSSLYNRNFII